MQEGDGVMPTKGKPVTIGGGDAAMALPVLIITIAIVIVLALV